MDGLIDAMMMIGGFLVVAWALRRINKGPTAYPDRGPADPDLGETVTRPS